MEYPRENAIDFPCSFSWRAYYQETFYGEYLPSIEPPEPTLRAPVPEPEWTRQQWDYVKNLRGLVNHLQQKLNEHTTLKRREKGEY